MHDQCEMKATPKYFHRIKNVAHFASHFFAKGLTLDNPTFVISSGDMASPLVGTNHILFGISQPSQVTATISDPSSGRVVRSYSGVVPAGTIGIAWPFDETDGTTPYTNETYAVEVQTSQPFVLLSWTNTIDRQGVRDAAGVILNYEEEYPDWTGMGSFLNTQLDFWGETTAFMYESLYYWHFLSFPQYTVAQIGANRENPAYPSMPFVLNPTTEGGWRLFLQTTLSNRAYSDFNFGPGHGNGFQIGGSTVGSRWVTNIVDASDVQTWAMWAAGPSTATNQNRLWRMRKGAVWACYSGDFSLSGAYRTWPEALGIRDTNQQLWKWMMKNAGLFFAAKFPQGGYGGSANKTSAEVAHAFDELWVYGKNAWSGGCDPTYAFQWAALTVTGMYPELAKGKPIGIGYPYLPYTGVYDTELMFNNTSHVKTQ